MRNLYVLVKPASGSCNLRCRYCFYADEMRQRETASYGKMSRETAEALISKSLNQADGHITFAFQGGEPTLAGLEFYRWFMRRVQELRKPGQSIHYAIQTNGTLLNEEWGQFLQEHRVLVGLSLDGPRKSHDYNRRQADGSGSWNKVMQAAALLRCYRVEFNILTVVTQGSVSRIGQIYAFFRENQLLYQQYIPCIDPLNQSAADSLTPQGYGQFLKALFDQWYEDISAGRFVYIRSFENMVGMLRGQRPESCDMGGICSVQYVFEADGSVYPCDFYALDAWRLGNIRTDSFDDLDKKRESLGFIQASMQHPEECRACTWYALCRNGCRRDRMNGQSRYCEGIREFYAYAYPRLCRLAGREITSQPER